MQSNNLAASLYTGNRSDVSDDYAIYSLTKTATKTEAMFATFDISG